jgi:hypothetical protein
MATLFEQVIAYAREQYGPTAASFDHDYGAESDAAEQWLTNALWHHSGADHAPNPAQARLRVAALRGRLAPELAAFRQQCRTRRYVGWSRWTTGPVRYAEDAEATRGEREVQVVQVTDPPDVD